MAAGKLTSTGFILTVLFISWSYATANDHYQTLITHSLPQPNLDASSASLFDDSQTLISSSSPSNIINEDENSLSLDLHHLDTLLNTNAIQNENITAESLFKLRLQRDVIRVKSIASLIRGRGQRNITNNKASDFSSSIISGLAQGSGEYFTRIGIGSPPRYSYMVLDTGSDVVWIQCSPCRRCYTQSDPIFDPSKSTTFGGVSCGTPLCNHLDSPGCNTQNKKCMYQVSYGDGSFTAGEFSTETLTFRKTKVNNIAFGCGHDNQGLFVGAAGLLGLGRGKLSFPNQAGRQFGSKFSYCLVDRSTSAKPSSLVFGNAAVSRVARFTPLLHNPKLDTFYYLGLNGFSVGGARVSGITSSLFQLDKSSGNGGVIIDSGTSVTRLTRPAYVALRNAFLAGASHLKRGPNFSLFDACFDLSGKTEVKVPTVVMHFNGADVSLPASNYLIPVDSSGSFCFAFAPTSSGLSIIGNIQQQGFRVVYDLAGSRVGFAPNGCA
ncbi:aspartyl protease family protein 2-like [Rutidosis leptorrhynchoides]|uniref:aspartyl protease family protein 2-like n=1 Tax=Rutidosis leptorrhynchoides TaxID=125765 RepID=UPI003A99E023